MQYLLLASLIFLASCQNSKNNTVQTIYPESAVDYKGQLFVSHLGQALKPSEKDGDGYISLFNEDLEVLKENVFPGTELNAPKGLLIHQETLYVADVDRVLGFDLKTNKLRFEMEISGTVFLNALARKNDHEIFVSASDIHAIFIVNLRDTTYRKLKLPEIDGANGLSYDEENKKLYVVGFGRESKPTGSLGVVDFAKEKMTYKILSSHYGYLDGLVKQNETLYFSDWIKFEKFGVIYSFNLQNGVLEKVTEKTFAGPADFIIKEKQMIIPELLGSRVTKENL